MLIRNAYLEAMRLSMRALIDLEIGNVPVAVENLRRAHDHYVVALRMEVLTTDAGRRTRIAEASRRAWIINRWIQNPRIPPVSSDRAVTVGCATSNPERDLDGILW